MPIFKYDPVVKQQFVSAAREVRANGRPWDEALMVAKTNGYKSGLPGLMRLVRESNLNGHKAEPVAKRKPGRARKTDIKHAPPAVSLDGLESIQVAINGLVKTRVAGVIAKIRAVLDEAERELG